MSITREDVAGRSWYISKLSRKDRQKFINLLEEWGFENRINNCEPKDFIYVNNTYNNFNYACIGTAKCATTIMPKLKNNKFSIIKFLFG